MRMAFIISVPPSLLPAGQKVIRLAHILFRRRHWFSEKHVGVAGKRDHIEGVVRVEVLERQLHRLFGLIKWKALHRAGSVEHKDQFFGHHIFGRDARRRLQDKREKAVLSGAMGQHGILNLPAGDLVLQDEIFVRNRRLIFESHHGASFIRSFEIDLVRL